MSYFDATDTLRKQLDERGVEWKPIDGEHIRFTEWCTHGGAFVYTARESFRSYGDHMLRVETCGLPKACLIATPDQVIAATLGNGTLTADDVLNAVYNHGARWQAIADELNAALGGGECENVSDPPEGFLCSACGWGDFAEPSHLLTTAKFTGNEHGPNFCPNCGHRVVSR